MARPSLTSRMEYYSTSEVGRKLELRRRQVIKRIKQGLFPAATAFGKDGLMLFDDRWVDRAKLALMRERHLITQEAYDAALSTLEEKPDESTTSTSA